MNSSWDPNSRFPTTSHHDTEYATSKCTNYYNNPDQGSEVDNLLSYVAAHSGNPPEEVDNFAPGGWSDASATNNLDPLIARGQQADDEDELDYDPSFSPIVGSDVAEDGSDHVEVNDQPHAWGPNQTGNDGMNHETSDTNSGHKFYAPDVDYDNFVQERPSRQQSIKPDAPYPGYARNTDSTSEEYEGASDINRLPTAASDIDDLFSDVEDVAELELDVPFLVGNTQKVARPTYNAGDIRVTRLGNDNIKKESEEDDIHSALSAESNESHNRPSPTESQLVAMNFEFHNEIPEDIQEADFSDKAFRKALREISPELSRKQQWYAYHEVEKMLQQQQATEMEEEGYDPAQPQRDFGSRPSQSGRTCQCGGDPTRCTCAPGKCGCSGCPRRRSVVAKSMSQSRRSLQASVEEDAEDVPMDIGVTPITPGFPHIYDKHGIQQIPGLGQLSEESEGYHNPAIPQHKQGHRCQCGDNCQCPAGRCQCPRLDAQPSQYEQDRLAKESIGWLIKKASDAQHKSASNSAIPPPNQPVFSNPPSSVQQSYYTPQQGFAYVRSHHSSEVSTPLGTPPQMTPIPPSRPDTPRPLDSDVRQSVEPEMPLPNWHRDSTPAYTDRSASPSPSPSPTSRNGDFDMPNDMNRADGIDDVSMRDITPTVPASRAYHRSREGSLAPTSPSSFSRSRFSLPRSSSPALGSSPSRHMMPAPRSPLHESGPGPSRIQAAPHYRQRSPPPQMPVDGRTPPLIPAPPLPTSTSIKPTKRGDKSKRKSIVQGSKIEKPKSVSRKVTAKQVRKTTEKIIKSKKEPRDVKSKKEGKVAEAVAKIEEKVRVSGQSSGDGDGTVGTPLRRSARVRERVRSGSPRVESGGMGG